MYYYKYDVKFEDKGVFPSDSSGVSALGSGVCVFLPECWCINKCGSWIHWISSSEIPLGHLHFINQPSINVKGPPLCEIAWSRFFYSFSNFLIKAMMLCTLFILILPRLKDFRHSALLLSLEKYYLYKILFKYNCIIIFNDRLNYIFI